MATVQKSLRLPRETAEAIEKLAAQENLDFSAAANQLLKEAVRVRSVPGIYFTWSRSGRMAAVSGTGLEVWEIIAGYRSVSKNYRRLRKAYHWLSEAQLRSALAYYALYPDEIDARIALDESWTPERIAKEYPFTVPPPPAPRPKRR